MKKNLTVILLLVLCVSGFAQKQQRESPLVQISPHVSEELLAIFKAGNEAFAARRYDEALQNYERGIKLAPNEAALWLNKAQVLLERGAAGYNAALISADEELRKQKREAAFQDFRDAGRAATRGYELSKALIPPIEPDFRGAYDATLTGALRVRAHALWVLTLKVDASYLNAAIEAFNDYFNIENDAELKLAAQFRLSHMLLTNHRYYEALTEYQKILQLDSNSVDASLGAAVSLLALGHQINDKTNIQDGLNFLARFIELAPEKHRLRGSAQEALTYLREASKESKVETKTDSKGVTVYGSSTAEGRVRAPIQGGVVNGKAINLPRPNYPLIAGFGQAAGTVVVQVIIDEEGNVSSARAVSGHPLLQAVSVAAAREAKFSQTRLSGQPVRVTGVITYNYVQQP